MKVLLIGGTGRLSLDTTVMCVNKGYDVYLINRGSNNDMSCKNLHYIISDINDAENTISKISDNEFDVVIDYLTFDLDSLKKRIKTFDGRTKQYIFTSSATVFLPNGEPISEDSPIGNDGWIYCKNKLICEEFLHANRNNLSFAYTIVRPYVTYDKKRIPFPIISKKSNWNLIYRIENNLPILVCGDGEQSVALTSTKDFAVGIVGLFGNSSAYYDDFNVVGDYNYTWNDVLKELEQFTGKRAITVHVPMERIGELVPSFREEVLFDKGLSHVFINTKIKSVVPQFRSTVTLSDGMNETFSFLSQNKTQQIIDCEWNAMESEVASKLGYKGDGVSLG